MKETRAELDDVREELDRSNDRASTLESDLSEAEERISDLTAEGEVPDFTGGTVADAEAAAEPYDWRIRTRREPSDEEPGTVIAQSVREGRMLKAGRSILLTVATEPPKQWETIASFSGSGSKKTDEFRIPRGVKARIRYTFTGDTNAILSLETPGDELAADLLLNEIGDYSDTTRVYDAAGVHYLDVQGGTWSIDVQVYR